MAVFQLRGCLVTKRGHLLKKDTLATLSERFRSGHMEHVRLDPTLTTYELEISRISRRSGEDVQSEQKLQR